MSVKGSIQRYVRRAFKALGFPLAGDSVAYDTFPTGGPWWDRFKTPRMEGNSIVMACVGFVGRTFPEAPLRVWNRSPEGDEIVFAHPLETLVEQPNPYYGGPLLWMATLVDYMTNGNAYWLKVRNGATGVKELWWIPAHLVEPKWDKEDSYVDWYDYRPKGKTVRFEQGDIVHFRYGLDADNPRKGKSPLASVISEVLTDNEATLYTQTILKNLGVPGVVVSPEEDNYASDEELEDMKQKFIERTTGSHRGEPLILTRKTNVSILSFSPQQMGLRELQRLPEERISAVLGIPAIVANLGAGLDRSTFANYAEAREAAYESLIIPMQRLLAADVQSQLLSEFGPGTRNQRAGFDTSNVRVLQDDQDKLTARLVTAVGGGIMTPNEARSRLGLPPADDDDGDFRLLPSKLSPINGEEPPPPPAPILALPAPAGAIVEPSDGASSDEDGQGDEEESEDGAAPIPPPRRARTAKRARRVTFGRADEKAIGIQGLIVRLRARIEPKMAADGLKVLEEVRDAVLEANKSAKGIADIVPAIRRVNMSRQLKNLFLPHYERAVTDTYGAMHTVYPTASGKVTVTLRNTIVREATSRIKEMELTTIREVREATRVSLVNGENSAQLVERLKALGAFSEERAKVIAVTELTLASNQAATELYKASPEFEGVMIHDLEGCAPDGPCVDWDGRELAFDEVDGVELAFHPNCTQMRSPIVRGKRQRLRQRPVSVQYYTR